MEELIFFRETDYPDQNVPVFTSVSSMKRSDFCGVFGDKVYPIRVPKGTLLFYISAYDCIRDEESEQEILLEKGSTKLINGELVFIPAKQ